MVPVPLFPTLKQLTEFHGTWCELQRQAIPTGTLSFPLLSKQHGGGRTCDQGHLIQGLAMMCGNRSLIKNVHTLVQVISLECDITTWRYFCIAVGLLVISDESL